MRYWWEIQEQERQKVIDEHERDNHKEKNYTMTPWKKPEVPQRKEEHKGVKK